MHFVQFSSHLIASMSSLKSMFSALAVHLTDFFLERIVEGLGKEAVLKQTWVQGNTSDIHFCSRTNQHNMCEPHRFGNDTHTYQICMEMIHNSVFVSLMGNYSASFVAYIFLMPRTNYSHFFSCHAQIFFNCHTFFSCTHFYLCTKLCRNQEA
jgi:hypothetical protein